MFSADTDRSSYYWNEQRLNVFFLPLQLKKFKISASDLNGIKDVFHFYLKKYTVENRISGVMVSVLASSAEDRGFELRSGQAKDYIKLVYVASALSMQH
jgi:hypothetical protein